MELGILNGGGYGGGLRAGPSAAGCHSRYGGEAAGVRSIYGGEDPSAG